MSRSAWDERRKVLEEEFFVKENKKLVENMKAESVREDAMKQLSKASGIKDEAILTSLVQADITAADLAALSLAPLVLVAWADSSLDPKEREAIFQAIREKGIKQDDIAYKLLMNWLVEPPDENLIDTWRSYMKGLQSIMKDHDFQKLKEDILQRAYEVAEAAGGFMGLGERVSEAEEQMLKRLRKF